MFMDCGLHTVELLVNSAGNFEEGKVAEYFNGFRCEDAGLFEWAECLISEPELQCEEYLFGVLSGISMALEHDQNIFEVYSMMQCDEHTYGLPYTKLVEVILFEEDYHSCISVSLVFTCSHCAQSSITRSAPRAGGSRGDTRQKQDHMIGVWKFLLQAVKGDHPIDVRLTRKLFRLALDTGYVCAESLQQLCHRLSQGTKTDDQYPLAEEAHTADILQPSPNPVVLSITRRPKVPGEIEHHRKEALAHDAAVEPAVKCPYPARRVSCHPVTSGCRGKEELELRGSFVPLGLEDPHQGTIGIGEFVQEVAVACRNAHEYFRESLANLLDMSWLQGKGIHVIVQMDQEIADFHGKLFSFRG